MSEHGIDISHNNGTFDFDTLSSSVAFAYAKASQDTDFTDPEYARNVREAKRTHRLVGAYHFLDTSDAAAQARHFASVIGKPGVGYLPPVLDVEGAVLRYGAVDVARRVREFFATADKLTGRKTGIYVSDYTPTWFGSQWASLSAGRFLWIARYGQAPTHACHVWQYDGTGTDLDQFNGTRAQLDAWANVSTVRTLRLTSPYMHGADVTAVQVALGRHGFPCAIDGVYGPKTAAAVLAFKKTVKWLPHNAIVGAGTRHALGI